MDIASTLGLRPGEISPIARRACAGATEGLSESIGVPLPHFIRDPMDADLSRVRQALGDERFAAVWTEGRQMTPDAVVAYVLQ